MRFVEYQPQHCLLYEDKAHDDVRRGVTPKHPPTYIL